MDQAGTAPLQRRIARRPLDRVPLKHGTSNCTALCDQSVRLYWPVPHHLAGDPGLTRVAWAQGGQTSRCYAWTPADGINYFTLFDLHLERRLEGLRRSAPEPYDITDAAPTVGTPDTMFVPFFWLDTGGNAGQRQQLIRNSQLSAEHRPGRHRRRNHERAHGDDGTSSGSGHARAGTARGAHVQRVQVSQQRRRRSTRRRRIRAARTAAARRRSCR